VRTGPAFCSTGGREAGQLIPVGYGPVRCEMTGPTFVDDTLIISVQHPGEDVPSTIGIRRKPKHGTHDGHREDPENR
jgi:secreted PhoX family phosphatase